MGVPVFLCSFSREFLPNRVSIQPVNTAVYQKLITLNDELSLLRDANALLGWDQETGMPPKNLAWRARQMAWFGGTIHEKFIATEVGDWISICENGVDLEEDTDAAANLRVWRHEYDRATKLPSTLVSEFEEARALAKAAWAEARAQSDFSRFAPHLEKLISLSKNRAEYYGYEDCAYDALIAEFERGTSSAELTTLFDDLRGDLVEISSAALEKADFDQARIIGPEGTYPIENQQFFNREVAEAIGFDFESGRIDTTTHPFCSGMGPGDTRLTTRYDSKDFRSSLYGVLHEAGHGLYEQGLRHEDAHGQPIALAVSLGIHESQSRLWENHVGRSRAFWENWLPRAIELFPHLTGISVDEMTAGVNQAERSHIRVEADECFYDLHVMLRFELEKAIFAGDLAIKDVPGEWNKRFKDLIGLEVKNDAEGCLQDIHWSLGIYGYFPTYSLGNLNASHLYNAALSQNSALESQLATGDYSGLLSWMRKNIHTTGSRYLPKDLIERASGSPVTAHAHLQHLRDRYVG